VKRNEVVIDGRLMQRGMLRYTPAGTPAIDFVLEHSSMQIEAGSERRAECRITAVALGDTAIKVKALQANRTVRITGFLARRGRDEQQLVLHATTAEQAGGNETIEQARS
jgi:primosomal replication protein N